MKTIILATPYLYGLDKCIEKNLIHSGYKVINLCYDNRRSTYPSIFHHLISSFNKKFLKNENYKKYYQYYNHIEDINKKLSSLNGKKADYALCIRANIYPKEIIQKIKDNSNICVNYQWDGINVFPDILEYSKFFDKFYVFDHSDIEKYPEYNLKPSHNFYFDYPLENNHVDKVNNGLYFLGGHQKNRTNEIELFLNEISNLNIPINFNIVSKNNIAKYDFKHNQYINYIDSKSPMTFEENLYNVRGSDIIVDFLNNVHQGLSFRAFDALGFDKKLITNNVTIKNYDFYHPNNIFIWNGNNIEELKKFIILPYIKIKPEIKEKYSFSYWIKNTL